MSSFEDDPLQKLPAVVPPEPGEKRATWWQITIAVIGAIAIVSVAFWGLNNQRDAPSSQQTAGTQATPATPRGYNPTQSNSAPATTGEGRRHQGDGPLKENQKSGQLPANSGQIDRPAEESTPRAQPQGQ